MAPQGKMNARQRAARQKRKMVLFAVEILIILIMIAVLYLVMNKSGEGPKVTYLDPDNLAIPSQVIESKEEGGKMHGYMNIALFGVDATSDKQLYKGSRSDSIMIANINMDTGDIKLVSIYRDTYLNIGDEFRKCNAAYSFGGAEQAVKMLNMNLDMDITNFVTVGYRGLSKVIDGLGGIYIDVDSEELKHINNYQISICEVLKCDYTPVTEAGYQLLNGLQATAYCRIRHTKGDDFQRAARQREVIQAIEEQAKKTDLVTLTNVFNDCIGDIYTSLDSNDILELLGNIANYRIVAEDGFPQPDMRGNANMGAKGACVIPTDLESNVVWLHQFLFGDDDYTVSDSVMEYNETIKADTTPFLKD
ncbi:LCP family protein [Acetatifactor muris]|uniref:Regulatory protein MsrR n=1 Tax=Acetatifactor muris TaxID=879566 RepID=A0A2K4ZF90_9FIRM|nr:LCP family protein [Acetatifactor muris]MCR2047335.1 LCP family protein [Acetatifactor muris]SOY29140.1 Regulatory protein MsrR [Acetatifactor muris]